MTRQKAIEILKHLDASKAINAEVIAALDKAVQDMEKLQRIEKAFKTLDDAKKN